MINIENTATVRMLAEDIIEENTKIQSVNGSISYILDGLNEYWSANQEDQQAFYKGLEESVKAIETIIKCNKNFSEAIIEYIQVTDSTSANVTI